MPDLFAVVMGSAAAAVSIALHCTRLDHPKWRFFIALIEQTATESFREASPGGG